MKVIEINGAVKLHEGQPQIVLNRIRQLKRSGHESAAAQKYDVENRGHYSADRLHPSSQRRIKQKPATTAIYGNDVEGEDPMQ